MVIELYDCLQVGLEPEEYSTVCKCAVKNELIKTFIFVFTKKRLHFTQARFSSDACDT